MTYTGKDHLRPRKLGRKAKQAKTTEVEQLKSEASRLSVEIKKLSAQVSRNKNDIDAISKSNEQHIDLLTNFMKHDMKNAILNLDTVLSRKTKETITDDNLVSLREQVEYISDIMKGFDLLVPSSKADGFSPQKLISAIETLHRDVFIEKKVSFETSVPDEVDLTLSYSFTSWLQISTNMIMNAIEHAEVNDIKSLSILFRIKIDTDKNYIYFYFYDNGLVIENENKENIFKYGYSEKNSSGVGLYHIQYLCSLYKGTVEIVSSDLEKYTKAFMISLPYRDVNNEEKYFNN